MLVTLVPLFDKNLKVCAYSLFAQKDNYFLNPEKLGIERHALAAKINGVEVLNALDIDTLSPNTAVFLPVSKIAVLTDIPALCDVPHDRLVLLLDDEVPSDEAYIKRLTELKGMGYKLAMKRLPLNAFMDSASVLKLMDYIYLNSNDIDVTKAKLLFQNEYPKIKLVVSNIKSQEFFDAIKDDAGFSMFEGEFYRMPVTVGETEIAPLKATYLQLLNVVNDSDFELTDAADVISRDTALTLSFLKMVNTMTKDSAEITSIRHAAAMLGQKELKKWINAVVTKELCADRPSEIMRLSLIRAKFAEELAPTFELATNTQELFLMGLFSVLDQILNCPMEDAIKKVGVSKNIADALVSHGGPLAPILNFIVQYEAANWQEISRILVVDDINLDEISGAYIRALCWYRDLLKL